MHPLPPDLCPDEALRKLLSSGSLVHGASLEIPPRAWSFSGLAGNMVELRLGGGALTLAARLTYNAQEAREACVWIREPDNGVFPPDLAAYGIDLEALVFVRVAEFADMARAAESLLHSGAIGLVVVEVSRQARPRIAMLKRLADAARAQHALVLLLTARALLPDQAACCGVRSTVDGPLRSAQDGRFYRQLTVLKDRRHGDWQHEEVCYGPDGLR
jgi:recombination protein RecA